MIKTVADLKRALDAFPDDLPAVASGNEGFGEYVLRLTVHTVQEEPVNCNQWAGMLPSDFATQVTQYGSYLKL